MKAYVIDKYSNIEAIRFADVPDPAPGNKDVLVRVKASSVNPADLKVLTGQVRLLAARNFPKVLGYDFSGCVEKVGRNVKSVRPGDEVFGFQEYNYRTTLGTFADLTLVNESMLALKPKSLTFEEAAAAATAAVTALQAFRKGNPQSGQVVLINGAGGGVGPYAVQIAKILGLRVMAFCSSESRDSVLDLGAEEVFDYRQTEVSSLRNRVDFFFDVVSNQNYYKIVHILNKSGTYLTLVPGPINILGFVTSKLSFKRCTFLLVTPSASDLGQIAAWMDRGKLRSVIGAHYPLQELKAALSRLAKGGTRGKIVLTH